MTSEATDEIAALRRIVEEQGEIISRWRLNGLSDLDTANLSFHPVQHVTATPTDTAPNGSLRVSEIGGVRRIWARAGGVWYSVVVT